MSLATKVCNAGGSNLSSHDESLRGVVHGRSIEFESELGLPDGQEVAVVVQPLTAEQSLSGEGIRRSAGAWADDDPEGLDTYLEKNRQARQLDRPEIES